MKLTSVYADNRHGGRRFPTVNWPGSGMAPHWALDPPALHQHTRDEAVYQQRETPGWARSRINKNVGAGWERCHHA